MAAGQQDYELTQMIDRLRSVDDFQHLIVHVRDVRRQLVHTMLCPEKGGSPPDAAGLEALRSAERILSEGVDSEFRHRLNFDSIKGADGDGADNSTFQLCLNIHVEDELKGLRKDLAYFDHVIDPPRRLDAFIGALAQFHPDGEAKFRQELAEARIFFNNVLSDGKVSFITDWDGTMKNYCSQYTSCLQPAYSASLIGSFVHRFTDVAAVLTAGPLRNFGILDLTALPEEGFLLFGGSWGREWLLNGKRVVNDAGMSDEAKKALQTLGDLVAELLEDEKSILRPFSLVGSGFQRKVDRICLGMQTRIQQTISSEKIGHYLAAVTECMNRVDAAHELFKLEFDGYDAEIVLKRPAFPADVDDSTVPNTVWDKGQGVLFLLEQLGLGRPAGRVLICGDTLSDIPMVERMVQLGKRDETYVALVDCDDKVKKKLACLIHDKQHRLFVSCPEVLHAAMALVVE